ETRFTLDGDGSAPDIQGRPIIPVDDGLATRAAMHATVVAPASLRGGSLVQRRFSRIALVGLWSLLLCGQAPLRDLPQSQYATLSDGEVVVTRQTVGLHIKDRPLQEVLRYIQAASGIRFSLPYTLLLSPVTAEIEAPDWPTAVRQLLGAFQTAEVWQDGDTQLRQGFILDSEAAAPAPPVTTQGPSGKHNHPQTPKPPPPPQKTPRKPH